jgi:hypothetical protein
MLYFTNKIYLRLSNNSLWNLLEQNFIRNSNQPNSSKQNWLANPLAMGLLTFILLTGLCAYVAYRRYTVAKSKRKVNRIEYS